LEKACKISYYKQSKALCERLVPAPHSVLDVGSNGCPNLEWFPRAERRVSVDIELPYSGSGIENIRSDFLAYHPAERFELCTCLQVLEHIDEPAPFARHLLAVSRHLVVSVPYMWPEGSSRWHVQDPVDEGKMLTWFGRPPDYQEIATEKRNTPKSRRMICYYQSD
jgi:hypothetical protein